MKYEYRITYDPDYTWGQQYYGPRYFPQRRWKLWFIKGDWSDMRRGSWTRPRGWPTLEQAEAQVNGMKLADKSVEVVL